MRIELIPVPVTDTDRAKAFYVEKAGFHADHDIRVNDDVRFVQLTPPSSACSIVIGEGTTDLKPGTQYIQVVVEDSAEVQRTLRSRGVEVSEIEELSYGIFVYFSDPDGNRWAVQQIRSQS